MPADHRVDELRIDLDPQPGTGFAEAVVAAGELRTLLAEHGIAAHPKTTASRGVHVYVRLEPKWTSFEVRAAAVAVARELERRRPDILTAGWWKEERGQRIFVDYNQNAPHKTVFGAWSARSRVGGQVSTPLSWDELAEVHPDDLTIATVPDRVAAATATRGPGWPTSPRPSSRCSPCRARHGERPDGRALAARLPEDAERAARVAPSRARDPGDG